MHSRKIALIVSAALATFAAQAGAGSLTIPNTFTSGATISSSEMNANFSDTATAVNGNATDITANTTAIGTNTTAIGANTTAIGTNTTAIGTNATAIGTNATAIATNATAIATNAAAISTATSCPSDMVQVGSFCIDKYEASLVDANGTAATSASCGVTGNDCGLKVVDTGTVPYTVIDNTATKVIKAQSVVGQTPAGGVTWFQAAQACANVGKRLPTNQEWQMAAAGTDETQCNLNTASVALTGASTSCLSNYGAYDMAGNLSEWVADWVQGQILAVDGTPATTESGTRTNPAAWGSDATQNVTPNATARNPEGTTLPMALSRGASYSETVANGGIFAVDAVSQPSHPFSERGFRCAKSL